MSRSVLVTGGSGQLAKSIGACSCSFPALTLHITKRTELDITSFAACEAAMAALQPALIINAAAFTNVDASESRPEEAYAVNTRGVGNLARAAAVRDIPIIHISTDYVFDGKKTTGYTEQDATNPINTYGQSKLDGEKAVIEATQKYIILRTAWLYSPYGVSFVSQVLNAAARSKTLSIVSDQIGNPTSVHDLAHSLLQLSEHVIRTGLMGISGIYHLANPAIVSRDELARQILAAASRHSGPQCEIRTALTSDFPTPALRPLRTALDISHYQNTFGLDFPQPEQSLTRVVRQLLRQGSDSQ